MSETGGMPGGEGGMSKTMIIALAVVAVLCIVILFVRDRQGAEPSTLHSNGGPPITQSN